MSFFFMGVATAAHQVEGDNVHSDFWIQENLPHSMFKEKSGKGVDHYNRYKEDLLLLKNAGLNAYRFTIEWARIEPYEGEYDIDALEHYADVIKTCEELGIIPIVTLHHFSSPAWLIKKGGWKDEYVVEAFAKYCRKIAEYYGTSLKYVCTINEANMGLQMKKIMDQYASIMTGDVSSSEGPQVGINKENPMEFFMLGAQESAEAFGRPDVNTFLDGRSEEEEGRIMRAHVAARNAIKEVAPTVKVGATFSLFDIQPLDGCEALADKLWYEDFGLYRPYLDGDDFIGVQNYTRKVVGPEGELELPEDTMRTEAGYEFYPRAIGNVVKRVASVWDKEIIVTENGISTTNDSLRQIFIKNAMEEIKKCVDEGINLSGYCHWSLLDNFEWQLGYDQQFGLIAVDRVTMERYPKQSLILLGEEYASIIKK